MSLRPGMTNAGSFKKGQSPHNKGIECINKLKKVEKFHTGQPIECIRHGMHLNWRLHTDNNVQCKICGKEWNSALRKKKPFHFLLVDAKQHAKKKGTEFTLIEEDLIRIYSNQSNRCALSNIEFDEEYKPSLDKIDPDGGYTKDNVQLVINEVNRMKTNLKLDRFLELCTKIANRRTLCP